MDETADGHNRCANQKRSLPVSSSSPTSVSSPQTWLPVVSPLQSPWWTDRQMEQDQDFRDHHAGMQSSPPSRFYEELYCSSQTSNPLVPLAGALMTSSGPQSDVVKQGNLGKLERSHRRYFVLRAGSHTGPSRLEWYKSQEKFTAMEKCAGKAALFGSSKQGVIYLQCCLGVSRVGSSKKGHMVALYAKDQTMVLVVEDQGEQEEWYLAIKKLMDEEGGEAFDEEDDGYCTLPPAAFFKEVWPVTVKSRSLGCSKSLAGESRLCLTATSLILVRVSACSVLPSVTIPLLSVRRFGHLDGSFFLELGRSAPNGPGEIWMEARDQGNPAVAQHIHEVVRETVRALRALPDFSRSPTSNHNQLQTLLASKRCRPKYRDKLVNVRPLGTLLALPPKNLEIQTSTSPTQCHLEPSKPDKMEPESTLSCTSHLSPVRSHQSSVSETNSYVEMKKDHHPQVNKGRETDCRRAAVVTEGRCSVAACGMEGGEPGKKEEEEEEEEEEEGLGYMMMSPQVSPSSSVLPQDDYVTMSPHKRDWPANSSPVSSHQTSFNSSTSDSYSPLHPSYHVTNEHSRPHWLVTSVQLSETDADQSQTSISCSTRLDDDGGQEQRRLPAQTRTTSSPVRSCDGSDMVTPFVRSWPGCTRPVQASPNSDTGRSRRLQSVRRYRLSLCLPSCLQTEDRS
ncbi:insulin receptor substrate 2-A-like [Dicentrarchus labrax]|uniref:insulin receptor substrate 2-A-like n=1 Tax=Dicentrarchus labrax TaxID=13489 RepID=UPI0021F56373|nr:insulin receptor substrate 2-A-like [Dicentrarchus labrax]XP_051284371.1 insulin receptor substrate 2-A-like [Dicentrarchus labrax]